MTPLQIAMMLHYYAIAAPYAANDRRHASSSAVESQRMELMVVHRLIERDEVADSGYKVTERGMAYVEALCAMPLPVMKWVQPANSAA